MSEAAAKAAIGKAFVGTNALELNQATMIEAIQHYFNFVFTIPPKVTNVGWASAPGSFEIKVDDHE